MTRKATTSSQMIIDKVLKQSRNWTMVKRRLRSKKTWIINLKKKKWEMKIITTIMKKYGMKLKSNSMEKMKKMMSVSSKTTLLDKWATCRKSNYNIFHDLLLGKKPWENSPRETKMKENLQMKLTTQLISALGKDSRNTLVSRASEQLNGIPM